MTYQRLRECVTLCLEEQSDAISPPSRALSAVPDNTLDIRFDIRFLSEHVKPDWALILLSAAAGYVSADAVLEFAITALDDETSAAGEGLALEGYETQPDWFLVDRLACALVGEVPTEAWSMARELLFYVVVIWIRNHWDVFDDPSDALFTIWDDFGWPEEGRVLSYHDSWTNDCASPEGCSRHMKRVCGRFLDNEKRRLQSLDNSGIGRVANTS